MADTELMTPREKQMEQRNAAIINEFKKLNPEIIAKRYKPYRTVRILAKKHGMTEAGIRYILVTSGTITSLKDAAGQEL